MRFVYGAADEAYPKVQKITAAPVKKKSALDTYSFRLHSSLKGGVSYDKNDVSILFKATPDNLLLLASDVVNSLPLPRAFEWTNWDVCRFIRNLGYPQYQRTFRKNLINGRTLLLIDAAALSAMNIKDFDHIKRITYHIRCLFHFELTKFARSISLPPHNWYDLYKLFRTRTGPTYEKTRRTDFWRQLNLLRQLPKNLSHFDVLERWIAFYHDPDEYPERFGGAPLYGRLYKECLKWKKPQVVETKNTVCTCDLCDCYWSDPKNLRYPRTLKLIRKPFEDPVHDVILECENCSAPPCTCQWKPSMMIGYKVLSPLIMTFPMKYAYGSTGRRSLLNRSFM